MPSLSASIVNRQVAPVRDVEQALSQQAIYGGDLITNLLELASVSEEALTQAAAESFDLEPAPIGELPVAPLEVRRLVPGDVAARFSLYPLEERAGALVLVVAEPLPAEVENDLSFSLGAQIEQRIAPLVRVEQAIARDYALPLERRTARILAKLAGKPDPSPSLPPPNHNSEPSSGARPKTPPPPAVEPERTSSEPSRRSEPAPRASVLPNLASLVQREPRGARRHHLGPYTPAMAEHDIMEAETRDDAVRAFFDFAAQYFEYAALFAVQDDIAAGRDAHGSGVSRARVLSIGVPLDLPSAMARVRDSGHYELFQRGSAGLDGALCKDLERRPGATALLLPIQMRERCVLILYGDHGDVDVELGRIGEVLAFVPLVSVALERLILKRKLGTRAGAARNLPIARAQPNRTPSLPAVERRNAALASVLEASLGGASIPAHRTLSPSPAPAVRSPTPSPIPARTVPRPVISIGPRARISTPPQGLGPSAPPVTSDVASQLSELASAGVDEAWDSLEPPADLQNGVASGEAPATAPGVGPGAAEDLTAAETDAVAAPAAAEASDAVLTPVATNLAAVEGERSTPTDVGGFAGDAPPPATAPATHDGPSISVVESIPNEESPPPLDEELARINLLGEGVPLAPASRSLSHSARPPPPRGSADELRLPSVIVDLSHDCEELLRALLAGDNKAGDQLVQIGEPAIPTLVAAFPGPITAELRRGAGDGPPRASECGPLIRTLSRMGPQAVPFLAVRTADGDPNVRAWATRLLGELPHLESARAVARRLLDEDAEVRRAALASGHMLIAHPDTREALQSRIVEAMGDETRPEEVRQLSIEALAELRAALGVRKLIRLLGDPSPDIVRSAHWALSLITRQDFGQNQAAWEHWLTANAKRHRIEWLIDALLHENQDIRRAAGDELKNLTKEYFGYYDDLPKRERERAQERYRSWWDSKGKARFR